MVGPLTEGEKMVSDAARRAYATGWELMWGDEPRLLISPSIDETKAKIREFFRHGRKIPAKLKDRAALERSEGHAVNSGNSGEISG